jgi:hypothetical protein
MDTALSGVAVVALGLLWTVITAIPLFLFGFCLHKCFTYFSETFRDTRMKRLLFPALTGFLFVVAGLATHIAALDLTGPSDQAKLSLFFSALLLVVDLPLMLVCIFVGIWHYRRRRRAQAPPLHEHTTA